MFEIEIKDLFELLLALLGLVVFYSCFRFYLQLDSFYSYKVIKFWKFLSIGFFLIFIATFCGFIDSFIENDLFDDLVDTIGSFSYFFGFWFIFITFSKFSKGVFKC